MTTSQSLPVPQGLKKCWQNVSKQDVITTSNSSPSDFMIQPREVLLAFSWKVNTHDAPSGPLSHHGDTKRNEETAKRILASLPSNAPSRYLLSLSSSPKLMLSVCFFRPQP